MSKLSIGRLIVLEKDSPYVEIIKEKGTLIQNCGYTKSGVHILNLVEALYLQRMGLLKISTEHILGEECLKSKGIIKTLQSMHLFELGIKNVLSANEEQIIFALENYGKRLKFSSGICKMISASADECVYNWLQKHHVGDENALDTVHVYLNLSQSYTFFRLSKVNTSQQD